MKINLKNYLEERDRLQAFQSVEGPTLTISRNFGCDEEAVIQSLITKLNQLQGEGLKPHPWQYIDKEILEESAHELGIKAIDVDHRVRLHHSAIVNELLSGFTHHYRLPDQVIINKVKEIITTYAQKGNVIIVGRGGIGVTRSIKNSLHIKLTAPLAHRVAIVSKAKRISATEAKELIQRMDNDRKAWAEHLVEHEIDNSIFDLTFNMETATVDEITDLIISLLQKRGLVSPHSSIAKAV